MMKKEGQIVSSSSINMFNQSLPISTTSGIDILIANRDPLSAIVYELAFQSNCIPSINFHDFIQSVAVKRFSHVGRETLIASFAIKGVRA
jgi:hypothetical protein